MRRFLRATLVLFCGLGWATTVQADPPRPAKQRLLDRVCNLIEAHADQNGLSRPLHGPPVWPLPPL